jgi:MFS family permease
MLTSPLFGTLSDYGVSRKALIVFGITAWSLSAASACFAPNFAAFLASRLIHSFLLTHLTELSLALVKLPSLSSHLHFCPTSSLPILETEH